MHKESNKDPEKEKVHIMLEKDIDLSKYFNSKSSYNVVKYTLNMS